MVLVNIITKKLNISDSSINTQNKFKYRWILYSKIFIFLTLASDDIKLKFVVIMLNKYIKC